MHSKHPTPIPLVNSRSLLVLHFSRMPRISWHSLFAFPFALFLLRCSDIILVVVPPFFCAQSFSIPATQYSLRNKRKQEAQQQQLPPHRLEFRHPISNTKKYHHHNDDDHSVQVFAGVLSTTSFHRNQYIPKPIAITTTALTCASVDEMETNRIINDDTTASPNPTKNPKDTATEGVDSNNKHLDWLKHGINLTNKQLLQGQLEPVEERSTLTLLEHVNLNVPNPHEFALPFYTRILGCGLDPRKAQNLEAPARVDDAGLPAERTSYPEVPLSFSSTTTTTANPKQQQTKKKSATVWCNAGPCQFHLPYGPVAQRIPGKIGLVMAPGDRWKAFLQRVQQESSVNCNTSTSSSANLDCSTTTHTTSTTRCIQSNVSFGTDQYGRDNVQLTDRYDNVFYCRPQQQEQRCPTSLLRPIDVCQQPIIPPRTSPNSHSNSAKSSKNNPTDNDSDDWLSQEYGRTETDCLYIDFIEFPCRRGTAARIAEFYEAVLDATVTVIQTENADNGCAAVIAIGTVNGQSGRADQSLVFREVDDDSIADYVYDGHHIALYVGINAADFDQAFRNCDAAQVVWINPRFADQANTLSLARHYQQFRFKDIIDLRTGEVLVELEHELRSVHHESWPGPSGEEQRTVLMG